MLAGQTAIVDIAIRFNGFLRFAVCSVWHIFWDCHTEYLGSNNDLLSWKVEFLDGLSQNDFASAIGIDIG